MAAALWGVPGFPALLGWPWPPVLGVDDEGKLFFGGGFEAGAVATARGAGAGDETDGVLLGEGCRTIWTRRGR